MARNSHSYNNQLEIHDLIDDAVENALDRRNQAMDSEDAFLAVSDEEAASIAGGANTELLALKPPIIIGLVYIPQSSLLA